MEEDCVSALYESLGRSAGEEFSSQDVSFLFDKVFHASSNTDEARAAMKKIAGGDKSWSCSGQNVLDVLIEMERERERKEILYWNFQLLNTGSLPHLTDCSHPSTDADVFNNTLNLDSGSIWPHRTETAFFLTGGLLGEKKLGHIAANVRRLKKAAGHSWALLASLGVRGLLPSPWHGPTLGIQSQAWGCVSLSDVLLLVEVKYDAVAHLLYREMLQEHHTESVWEKLPPWQQHQEVEVLEDLAEEALESVDLLGLAVLPGAFRIYKMCPDASSRSCLELRKQSWSAVSLLNDLHTFRQQEQNTLTALGQRLCGENLRLLCLYIRLATCRAQREKMSHRALLAARQSWDSWWAGRQTRAPCCRSMQSRTGCPVVLRERRGEGHYEDTTAVTKENLWQQTELQLLVWTQEQERKHLLSVLHGISVEDLHKPDGAQTFLRSGCLRRLRQIHAQLQKQSGTQTPSRHTNFQTLTQVEWSQVLLEDCAMLLLTGLIELQEIHASFLLQELLDRNAQGVQVLRRKYEAELETKRFTNLLHLISDDPPTPGFVTENTHKDLTGPESSSLGEILSDGAAAAPTVDSVDRTSREQTEVQTANDSAKQEVCSGCGAVMEDLPYLEILRVPDTRGDALESLDADGGTCKEDEASATESHQSYEKQRSLITLAWSKPSEDDEAETADGETERNRDDSTKTQVQSTQCGKTVQETDREDVNPTLLQNGSSDHQYSTTEQQNLKKKPVTDRSEGGDADATEAQNVERLQPNVLDDSFQNTDDLFSGTSDHTAREKKELCPTKSTLVDPRGPEHSGHEDRTRSQESTEFSLSERNRTRESSLMEKERHPVSAIDRERTMQNLVDMQRKFEEKHQRDKERQLLRVQERLSIIQNKKAEEDLLGLKHTDRLRHLTHDLPMEDKNQQKTVVKERLEQLRRERSYIMQSKRDRNTAVFKELLAPVHLHISETEDGTN